MYPQRELAGLSRRKAVLRFRIHTRRHQCRQAMSAIARPLAWFDAVRAKWREISPLAKVACAAAALLAGWTGIRARDRIKAILKWIPFVAGAVRMFWLRRPAPACRQQ